MVRDQSARRLEMSTASERRNDYEIDHHTVLVRFNIFNVSEISTKTKTVKIKLYMELAWLSDEDEIPSRESLSLDFANFCGRSPKRKRKAKAN